MSARCDHTHARRTWVLTRGYLLIWRRCTQCSAVLEHYRDDEHDDPPVARHSERRSAWWPIDWMEM